LVGGIRDGAAGVSRRGVPLAPKVAEGDAGAVEGKDEKGRVAAQSSAGHVGVERGRVEDESGEFDQHLPKLRERQSRVLEDLRERPVDLLDKGHEAGEGPR